MARPVKESADYFPLDVYFDDKFKLLHAEYGLKGFGLVIRLYQKIYANGYYSHFDADISLLFAQECSVTGEFVTEVLACCFRRAIFDKKLYEEFKILTSRGIQKRYIKIKERSTIINLDGQYLLLPMQELADNVTVTTVNVDNNSKNADINSQSKGNKNKEKNKPEKRAMPAPRAQAFFSDDSQEMVLAKYLFAKIIKNNPEAKEPNFQKWAKEFDLLLRVDKRKADKTRYLIDFALWHKFWKINILSPASLRASYDRLTVAMEEAKKK